MTRRQLDILNVIRAYYKLRGDAPTLRLIAARLGISATTVHEHIQAMVQAGLLQALGTAKGRKYIPPDLCPTCHRPWEVSPS